MKKSALFLALSLALVSNGITACSDSDNNNENNNNDNPKQECEDVNGCGSQGQGSEDPQNPGQEAQGKLELNTIKSTLQREKPVVADEAMKSFVAGQYDLNFELIRTAEEQLKKDNAMISTFSIQTALAMTYAGANGDTAAEMKSALHFDDSVHKELNKIDAIIKAKNKEAIDREDYKLDAVEVKTSNNLYYAAKSYQWADEWLDALALNYDAGITEINFGADPEGARKYINDIVSKDTHNRINDLIPKDGITALTRAVITNSIYFKAPWASMDIFKASDKLVFHKLENGDVNVDYLIDSAHYAYMEAENYQAVSVPLREGDFEVLFVLPSDGKFIDVQNSLDGSLIGNIFDSFSYEAQVNLKMPCYTFETSLSLSEPFKMLGMNKAFGDSADFSKMTTSPNDLYISEIYHKSFVALNEDGIEAAAATAVIADENAIDMPEKIVDLTLDRPYFFVIYESETKSPLFVGRVMDPSAK